MHSLIITPHVLQGAMFANSLKRQNIKSFVCSPQSIINHDWHIKTDVIVFQSPLKRPTWLGLTDFLSNFSEDIPFVLIGRSQKLIFKQKQFQKFLKRSIFIDDSLPAHEIPELIQEIITKTMLRKKRKYKIGQFYIDRQNHTLVRNGKEISLTTKEFFLLELLMINAGQVITRDRIINHVWDKTTFVSQNTVDVYVSRVRKKLKKRKGDSPIKTVPCLGYEFSL